MPSAPSSSNVLDLFTARATSSPQAVTVKCGEERRTYATLAAAATAVARNLRARGVRPGGKLLVGYCAAPSPIPTETIRAALADTLPEFMIPSYFERMEAIPLTPNGKADRTALPAPGRHTAPSSSTRPLSPDERVLSEVWTLVVGRLVDASSALGGRAGQQLDGAELPQ